MSKRKREKLELLKSAVNVANEEVITDEQKKDGVILNTKTGNIKTYNNSQQKFIDTIKNNDIVFAIGPAGTGKTFLATALAVSELKSRTKKKIIICRPVVESGEKLGFLPGGISEKLDPYTIPIQDSLQKMIQVDILKKNMERKIIEIAPIAYMRGRTFDDCFMIIDEAQNATFDQLKLILTRIGENTKIIVTGDPDQSDLPKDKQGFIRILNIIKNVENISHYTFTEEDVVRSKMCKNIVKAFKNSKL